MGFREFFARLNGCVRGDAERIDPVGPRRSQSQVQLGIRSSAESQTVPPILRRQKSLDAGATSKIPSAPAHHLSVSNVNVNVNGSKPASLSSYVVDPTAAYENKPDWKSTVAASARLAVDVLKESSDAFTPLKSVVGGLSAVLKNYDQATANRKTIESLLPRIEGLAESLSTPAPESETKEIDRRQALTRKLEEVLRDLEPLAERGKITGFLNNVKDAEVLAGLAEDIRDAMMDYQTALQQDIYYKSHQLIDGVDRSLLNGMHHTADAGYLCGDRNGCLKGTRKDVILQIEHWLTDEKDQHVFWLNGLAGTGKSTIAQTFAEIAFADGKLGASFFCSRDFEERSNLRAIFPTLAFQLAYRYPQFREQLLQVLKTNPDVGRESLCSQLEKVIIHPLKATQIPTLIIIDALDECKDKEPASALLSVLSRYVHDIPEVKFFITGRPEPPIREGFRLESLRPITDVLKLHDVERSSVDGDIKLYLRTHLTNIPKTRTGCKFPEEWPSAYDIDLLCKKAAGLFIYASTVVKFIASKHHLPTERLDFIILRSQGAAFEGGINILYTQILELAFHDVDSTEEEVYSRFRTIVGAVLLVSHPLSRKTLSDLVRNCGTPSHISTTLDSLHSLLDVPDSEDEPIRVFHKSFPDFLTDRTRCKDARFFVDPPVLHEVILFSCLDLMKERLKKNICGLDDYAALSEVEDLPARRETFIGGSLEYACRFWTRHLISIPGKGPHVGRIQEAIDEFFTMRLLCWIEVLGISGHLGGAVYAINDIRQWYISTGILTSERVDDSERLVLEHFDVIRDSPSHIYHSALPLCPSPWLRRCYKAEVALGVKVLMGLPEKWDTCSRTISIEGEPSIFAHWGDTIAIGKESDVVLLDAITGRRTSVLSGHAYNIHSLAFSLDGTLLVSGSVDKTVKLWDIQTGGVIKTFSDPPFLPSTVSISSDCTTIASGTHDGTIRLWDIRTGKCRPVANRHDNMITAITFSPTNPRHLISSSYDGTVRKWDVDGHQIGTPYREETGVENVAYASDGARFVSCGGAAATVRETESGMVVVKLDAPKKKAKVKYSCFSPDGRFVACATGGAIYVWDIANSEARLVGNLVGHARSIRFIAFSTSLISGSDLSVKFWQSSSFLTDSIATNNIPPPPGSSPIISANLFAEDGTIVTSDSSGVVKTWEFTTGRSKSSFSTPSKGVQDTHLAGDTLIVVWCPVGDKEYHIWDVGKGELLRTVGSSLDEIVDLRISGDGSKIFGAGSTHIEARSIHSGEDAGIVEHGNRGLSLHALFRDKKEGLSSDFLVVRGCKVWLAESNDAGWDFEGREVSPFTITNEFLDQSRLRLVDGPSKQYTVKPVWIQDTVTGRSIFHLPARYLASGMKRRWDGRYLLVWSPSGEMMVMDFSCVFPL